MGITRNGDVIRTVDKVKSGDVITVKVPVCSCNSVHPAPYYVTVQKSYEDDDIVIYLSLLHMEGCRRRIKVG